MIVMEINDIFAEEKKEVKAEEPKVEEKSQVEESKIKEKSQEEAKREELINDGWTLDEKTGTLTKGLDEKEWNLSKNEYITSKTKSNSTDGDKAKAEGEIKRILEENGIIDDTDDSKFNEILNEPDANNVRAMLLKNEDGRNIDKNSVKEIISNWEIIKGKC